MLYPKKYVDSSPLGRVEYFNERLSPETIGSNYLECGKNYLRADYPQVVADLFPYNIKEHAKDHFQVMSGYDVPPFHVTAPEPGPPYELQSGRAFDNNPYTAGEANYAGLTFTIDAPLTYTISHGKITLGGIARPIKLELYYPHINKTYTVADMLADSDQIYYVQNIGILEQAKGFSKFSLYIGSGLGVHAINLYCVPGSDIENNVIKGFTVPEAPEKPGYKAYVNIDYRGIEAKHYL